MSGLSVCRGCSAAIRWVTTRQGKNMPVDPEFLTEWLTRDVILWSSALSIEEAQRWAQARGLVWPIKYTTLVTPEGDTIRGAQCSAITFGAQKVEGYVPHWQTCPVAQGFKR